MTLNHVTKLTLDHFDSTQHMDVQEPKPCSQNCPIALLDVKNNSSLKSNKCFLCQKPLSVRPLDESGFHLSSAGVSK